MNVDPLQTPNRDISVSILGNLKIRFPILGNLKISTSNIEIFFQQTKTKKQKYTCRDKLILRCNKQLHNFTSCDEKFPINDISLKISHSFINIRMVIE